MELLFGLVLLALVAYLVTRPLRHGDDAALHDPVEAELADLEARKEARYREIRDAESDHVAGKLADDDFSRLDAELRREAIEILKRIDKLREPGRGDSGS